MQQLAIGLAAIRQLDGSISFVTAEMFALNSIYMQAGRTLCGSNVNI